MISGRWVLRNITNRDDAVYIVTATLDSGVYTVTGQWGKWDTFMRAGKLGHKPYYEGVWESAAQRAFYDLVAAKKGRNYYRVYRYDTALPWEHAAPIATTPPPKPDPTHSIPPSLSTPVPLTRQDIQTTRAGLLEF